VKVVPIKKKDSDGCFLSLKMGKEYEVLGIEADFYRILNDSDKLPYGNDPVLFAPDCFRISDSVEPVFWVCEYGDEGERYCYPPEWQRYFFEDYHEGVQEIRQQFWRDLQRYYPEIWKEYNAQM